MQNYLDIFRREMRNRSYSRNTIREYCLYLDQFLRFNRKTEPEPDARIAEFLDREQKTSEQRRLAWSAIKLF